MLNTRGVIALSLLTITISILLIGFSDKLKRDALCQSVATHTIDRCARTGGFYGN